MKVKEINEFYRIFNIEVFFVLLGMRVMRLCCNMDYVRCNNFIY